MTRSSTKVLSARYHEEGYISAQWETTSPVALKSFALVIMYEKNDGSGQSSFAVEDGLARIAGWPYTFEPDARYKLVVMPFDGEGFQSASPPFPIPNPLRTVAEDNPSTGAASDTAANSSSSESYRLEFVERLPYTPLLIDAGWNVLKVKLTSADGKPLAKQPIHWRIPPGTQGARLEKANPTSTGADGIAANRIYIDRSALMPNLLTVSAWYEPPDGKLGETAYHVAELFESVEVRVFCSFVRDSAHPWTENPIPEKDEFVTATATVLDDQSRPVRGLRMAWRMHPNAASVAYEVLGAQVLQRLHWKDSPPYERGFPVDTNAFGRTTIKFANSAPQIMGVAPAVNAEEYPTHAVFSAVDRGSGSGTQAGLPLTNGYLDLDQYPDTVPVTVSPEVGATCDAAIWLNDAFVTTVYIGTVPQYGVVRVPSEYFVPGELNRIGYIQSGIYGNGTDSVLSKFRVKGKAHIPEPTPGGTLAPPRLEAAGVTIINDSAIAGGLALRIPAYASIAAGDEVTLGIYLEGYYQNTDFKKNGFYQMLRGVVAKDVPNGFVLIVDEAELRGYAASSKGKPGRFRAQYAVSPLNGAKQYSQVLVNDNFVTSLPDLPSEWVAFSREP